MNKNFVPLQQLPNGQWLATFCLYHRNVFTDEVRPHHHQVQFTNKPTVEMLKRRLRTFILAYPDELEFDVEKFDFTPYLIY